MNFKLHSTYQPAGTSRRDRAAYAGVKAGEKHQVLLGVTGSGKTFTMAKVIEASNRPALVLAHNKTLAAAALSRVQALLSGKRGGIFRELLRFLPTGSVMCLPRTCTLIKKRTINDELDKLRMSATRSLLSGATW